MDATSPVRVSVAGATMALLLAVLTLPFGPVARLPTPKADARHAAVATGRYRDGSPASAAT